MSSTSKPQIIMTTKMLRQSCSSTKCGELMVDQEKEEGSTTEGNSNSNSNSFDCNICLEACEEPVVTMCGHLFCWPCLYRWLHTTTSQHGLLLIQKHHSCPVCKADLKEKIIPLYVGSRSRSRSRSSDNNNDITHAHVNYEEDHMEKHRVIPSRPSITIPCNSSSSSSSFSSYSSSSRPEEHYRNQLGVGTSIINGLYGGRFNQHGNLGGSHHYDGSAPFSSSFGIFPALLGFQLSSYSYNGVPTIRPNRSGSYMPPNVLSTNNDPQQQKEGFIVHWLFILLSSFAVACLLFF